MHWHCDDNAIPADFLFPADLRRVVTVFLIRTHPRLVFEDTRRRRQYGPIKVRSPLTTFISIQVFGLICRIIRLPSPHNQENICSKEQHTPLRDPAPSLLQEGNMIFNAVSAFLNPRFESEDS